MTETVLCARCGEPCVGNPFRHWLEADAWGLTVTGVPVHKTCMTRRDRASAWVQNWIVEECVVWLFMLLVLGLFGPVVVLMFAGHILPESWYPVAWWAEIIVVALCFLLGGWSLWDRSRW